MRVVIVGAGIAGLAAAIALRKDDCEIVVLEQSSLNREIGATISLQPNASKIVEQTWGMRTLLVERGVMIDEGFQVYNLDGECQMSIPLKTTEKYGAERLIFHRIDLHEALKHRATSAHFPGQPAKIVTSSRVVGCNCENGTVVLADGTLVHGDLIIGADGIKSAIRNEILGKEVAALKTGHSAYRMVIPTAELEQVSEFTRIVDPTKPFTTMVLGHDKRLIMGPARNGTIYSVVAMIPDETMNESSDNSSWVTEGDVDKMLQSFADFPSWAQAPLRLAKHTGLWQLRDIDQLPTWTRGRAILIGDAAHAMLPTQGQGASQSIEDAEAIGAFFVKVPADITAAEVEHRNHLVLQSRYERASLIQSYSRQSAKPATELGAHKIKMNPAQFMDYNCQYNGAKAWLASQTQKKEAQDAKPLPLTSHRTVAVST